VLAPSAALGGKVSTARGTLTRAAVTDLRQRLGATAAERMVVTAHDIAGVRVVRATHQRHVALGTLDSRLKGVFAVASQRVLIGINNRTAAILGGLPESTAGDAEVHTFVQTLLAADRIAFLGTSARYGIKSATRKDTRLRLPTHAVHRVGGTRVLRRVRFAC
jgi:hypothetical protein